MDPVRTIRSPEPCTSRARVSARPGSGQVCTFSIPDAQARGSSDSGSAERTASPRVITATRVAGASDIGYGYDDYPPTTQQVEVHEVLKQRLTTYRARLDELLDQDLPAFNTLLKENDLANIIVFESP